MCFLAILFLGIREDMLMIECAALFGGGVILLLIQEPKWLIYLQILYCLVNKFLISQFGFPNAINYATDLLMLLCLGFALKTQYEKREKTFAAIPLLFAFLFFFIGTFSTVFQGGSVILVAWSWRNLMRFFAFFFSCIVLLDMEDIRRITSLFPVFFWANVLTVSFQFWIQGYSQDNLGGLFGTDMGCNGHMNTFLCIYLAYICVNYIRKKISFRQFFLVSLGALYIAALSELKFLFVEYVFILGMAMLFSRFSWRVLLMIAGAVFGLYIGITLFNNFFPGWDFSLEQIVEYAGEGGYSTATDLNRMTALQRVSEEFLTEPMQLLFGLGLGNCETSSFFESSFFQQYGATLHYTYLLQAFTLLETGWVGLALFLGFFVSVFCLVKKYQRMIPEEWMPYYQMAGIIAVVCVVHCFYNNALRVENSGYLAYYVLAIPFICRKGLLRKDNGESKFSESQYYSSGL